MPFSPEQARQVAATFDLEHVPDDFYDDPFPYYHALREHEPVRRMPNGSYFLTRYRDLLTVYKDTRRFSSDKKKEFGPKFGDTPLYEHHTSSLVFNDPPSHTRVRRLIMGALSPRHIEAMEPGLIDWVDRLLDAMEDNPETDLVEHFAASIPINVIGNLLGVPADERGPLRGWSQAILGALEPTLTAEQHERGNRAVTEAKAYLENLVAKRRANPGDPETDVLTRLILGELDGEKLTHNELLHSCIFMLNAGHETTTYLIGNGLKYLHDCPEQKAKLLAEPGLIDSTVEEILRFQSSNQLGNRITTEAVEIGGIEMPPQTFITLCIGAANRDPEQFPDPDRFDITRSPNRHLAFASGAHQCAGMHLGRMEAKIALSHFLARFGDYALTGAPVRARRARFRGFVELPARVKPRVAASAANH